MGKNAYKELFADVKQSAIEHWELNLYKVQNMDWDDYSVQRFGKPIFKLLERNNDYPNIFSNACPYCQKSSMLNTESSYCGCNLCPLYSKTHKEVSCCPEWMAVWDSMRSGSKESAIAACEKMIEYIEVNG